MTLYLIIAVAAW